MAAADAAARHKHIVFLNDTLACRELIRRPDTWTQPLLEDGASPVERSTKSILIPCWLSVRYQPKNDYWIHQTESEIHDIKSSPFFSSNPAQYE